MATADLNCFYVYALLRPDLPDPFYVWLWQPFYFGKGCDWRMYRHRQEANKLLHKSGRKDIKINIIHTLWENNSDFKEVILFDNLIEKEAFALEKKLIAKYGRINNGTGCLANLTDGGEGSVGYRHTEEIIQWLRIFQKRKKHTEEHKKELSERWKGELNPNFGRIYSAEEKQIVSDRFKGVQVGEKNPFFGCRHTEETKKKISEFLIEFYSNNVHPCLGMKHSEESRRKNSESHLGLNSGEKHYLFGKHPSGETKRKIGDKSKIPVEVNGMIFESTIEAAKFVGITVNAFRQRLRKNYPGYVRLQNKRGDNFCILPQKD
jgi:hypothetical protein